MKKIAPLLLIILIGSMWLAPTTAPVLSILIILFSLGMAVSAIFRKHKASDDPRLKLVKDVLIVLFTFLLIIFLGGLAGLLTNEYLSPRYGTLIGFVAAIMVSLGVGYLVRRGVGKLTD